MFKRQLTRVALVATGLGVLLVSAYLPSRARIDGLLAHREARSSQSAEPDTPESPRAAESTSAKRTAAVLANAPTLPTQPTDPFGNPIVGDIDIEATPTGGMAYAAKLAAGYTDSRPLPTAPEPGPTPEPILPRAADEPPPGHTRLDPARFGFKSAAEMEKKLRAYFHVPADRQVRLFAQERNGRQGVSIMIAPPRDSAESLEPTASK